MCTLWGRPKGCTRTVIDCLLSFMCLLLLFFKICFMFLRSLPSVLCGMCAWTVRVPCTHTLGMLTPFFSICFPPGLPWLLASERSDWDTLRGNTIENRGCLFVYIYDWMYVCHFVLWPSRIFVFAPCSTPSLTSLNRILWFSDHYLYHPRNWIVYRFEFFCECS